MARTLNITLDLYNENRTVYKAKQGDANSRFLLATITELGVPFSIPSNNMVYLKVRKPDETCTLTQGVISDGKALVELTNQTLAVAGIAYCEIRILQNDPIEDLKTIKFTMQFDSSVFSDEIVESTDQFTALEEALAAAGSIGKVSDLKTEDKSTLVAGVNELADNQGTIADLTTTATDLVGAINELDSEKEDKSNKVTSISGASTDTQYPSAKLTYDQLALKEPNLPATPLLPTEKFLNGNKAWAVPAHNKLTDLNTDAEHQHMSSDEKTKLTNIEGGAEVNIIETISIDTADLPPDVNRNVNIPLATALIDGAMSKEYAGKLDGIAENANNYSHPNHSGDVTSVADGAQTIANNAVTNAKLAQMNTKTIKGNDTAGTANAKDLTVAETKALLDIDDLEAQVNSVPVSGTSKALTKSLSNTSAGITQALTVKGLTTTQLVTNGNFTSGTSGYTAGSGSLAINIDGNLVMTGNGTVTTPYVEKSILPSTINNSKILIKCRFRCLDDNVEFVSIFIRDLINDTINGITTINNPVKNQWYEVSNIKTTLSFGNALLRINTKYVTAAESNNKRIEIDYIMVINLTTTYGAGLEPDLATCQTLFPSYFDGTKSVDKGEVTVGTGTAITRARYPKLQSVPAIQDTYNVLSGLHTQNIQTVATTNGTAINTTNYPLAKNAVAFRIALTAGGEQIGVVGTDTASGDGTLYYQLNVPVLTYYPPKSIPLEINSSIIHQSIIGDIAFYSTGIAITDTTYPIATLQEVMKVNVDTGAETPIDIATCTVASGGLSFTSTALTDGDLVWFRYSHALQSLVPTTDYTYTTSLAGGLTTIQQDVKKQNESLQKQIDELRAIIASMAV